MPVKAKKVSKIDQILNNTTKTNERVAMLTDSTRNDKFMLTHLSQEVEVVKNEMNYIRGKQSIIVNNPFVIVSAYLAKILNKIPIELMALAAGIAGTLAVLKLMGVIK